SKIKRLRDGEAWQFGGAEKGTGSGIIIVI
ncbi:hypothetical protein AVEN_191367-1, partial [Araneus ventricosus]